MRPDDRDAAFLWDMREAAADILEFTHELTFEDFKRDKKGRYAVERQIMVLGEAAKKVSESFRSAHPDIPWAGIIAQRNVIAHEYGEIIIERIWRVARERVPKLLKLIDPLIPPEPAEEE